MRRFVMTGWTTALAALLVLSCSGIENATDDDDDDAETSAADKSSDSDNVSEKVREILGGEGSVSSIGAMPNLGGFVGGGSASLTQGTAPAFISIDTKEEVQKHLTGDIPELVKKVKEKLDAGDASGMEKLVRQFNKAVLKCEMMEDTIENLQMLRQQTTSACYIGEITKANAGIFVYESGAEFDSDEDLLSPSEDGSEKLVKILLPPEEVGGDPEEMMIAIEAKEGKLSYKLDFCQDGTAGGRDTITFNNKDGDHPILTLTSQHSESFTGEGEEAGFSNHHVFDAVLVAPLRKVGEGDDADYDFVPGVERYFTGKGYEKASWTGGSSEQRFRTRIGVTDKELVVKTRAFGKESFTEEGESVSHEFGVRGIYGVEFTGSSLEDTAIVKGAGKRSFFIKSGEHSDSGVERVAFNYNESAAPTYESVGKGTVGAIFDKIVAIKTNSDDTLKELPKKPKFDFSVTSCGAEPEATYKLNGDADAFATVASKCESEFEEEEGNEGEGEDGEGEDADDGLCQAISNVQHDILDHINSCDDCSFDPEEGDADEKLDSEEIPTDVEDE